MIELDGNFGEGGGSIVRIALALSTLTNKPFKVKDIRKGRTKSGLKMQHLFGVKALRELCDARVDGAHLGSEEIMYVPNKIKAKTLNIDIGTAGSITLLLQSVLLPCIFAEKAITLRLRGGTDTKWSMPIDYFMNVLIPHLQKFAEIKCKLERRGYYPKGGGQVEVKIKPKLSLSNYSDFGVFLYQVRKDVIPIYLIEQGKIMQIKGLSNASKDLEKAQVAERQANAAKLQLGKINAPVNIQTEYCDTLGAGSAVVLWAMCTTGDEINLNNPILLGGDGLGEKGKLSEAVGEEAGKMLSKELVSNAAVDEHLADNLIPYLALVGGKMKVSKISKHTLTNIYVVEQFLDVKFDVDEKTNTISVNLNK